MKRAVTRVVVVLTAVLMLSTCTTVPPREDLSAPEAKLRPLIEAARKGDTEKVQALLAKDADVNAKAIYGTTALMFAALEGHPDTVQALLAKGADVNAKDNYGTTALITAKKKGHKEIVQLLKKAGAKE